MQITTDRRDNLRPFEGKRVTFTGIFERFEKKRLGWDAALIYHIYRASTKEWIIDHAWIDAKPLMILGLQHGDYIKFTSRVHRKGGRWFISWPTRVRVLNEI